jgi:hypothetical protein
VPARQEKAWLAGVAAGATRAAAAGQTAVALFFYGCDGGAKKLAKA